METTVRFETLYDQYVPSEIHYHTRPLTRHFGNMRMIALKFERGDDHITGFLVLIPKIFGQCKIVWHTDSLKDEVVFTGNLLIGRKLFQMYADVLIYHNAVETIREGAGIAPIRPAQNIYYHNKPRSFVGTMSTLLLSAAVGAAATWWALSPTTMTPKEVPLDALKKLYELSDKIAPAVENSDAEKPKASAQKFELEDNDLSLASVEDPIEQMQEMLPALPTPEPIEQPVSEPTQEVAEPSEISELVKSETQEDEPVELELLKMFDSMEDDERVPLSVRNAFLEQSRKNTQNHHGISDIPDPKGFVAIRGTIELETPGGGTLESIDDLKEFGLQP